MLQFLTAVLPSTGTYVITTGTPKADGSGSWFKNYNCDTINEVVATASRLDGNSQRTIFFALGNYRDNVDEEDKVRRTSALAFQFKTLAFDVDPKDRNKNPLYATQRDMAATVLTAAAALGLPDPVFVSSGNGLHCYYPLTHEISKEHWRKASELLRDALLSTGMALDTSKICDPSMVLRPVGTLNKKTDPAKPVRLLSPIQLFDPVDLIQRLLKVVKPSASPKATAARAKPTGIAAAVLDNEFPPADAALVEAKCPQVGAVAATRGNVLEPIWYATLGIAAYTTDPEAAAIRWSDGHPKFDRAATITKMGQWKARSGPTTCAHFEKIDARQCSTCPHRGKITSPVQLGVAAVSDAVAVPTGKPNMVLPKGYFVKGDKIWRTFQDETLPVSDYLLFPTRRYRDNETGKSMCLLEVKLPVEGWTTRELPMDAMAAGGKDWSSWLLNHQIFVSNEALLKAMRHYIMTYLKELQLETESEVMCGSFGWVDDECTQFALGERLISKDGSVPLRLGPMAADIAPALRPKGDLDKWCRATAVFAAPGLEYHGLVFLMQVGSPIMAGSGLKSVLVNMYCPDSGTGKSTTGAFANSIYGNPDKLMLTVEDTQNATFKSMGVYGNLPVYIDEITKIDPKRLSHTLYFITNGREKRRLTKDGGFQSSMEWNNISTSSSNSDIYAVQGAERISIDGEAMRILQFPFDKNPIFNASGGANYGYKLAHFLKDNYGLAGEPFIRGILAAGGPFVAFDTALRKFSTKFDFTFTGKERFWQAAMVVAYAAGKIGTSLGLFQFDIDASIRKGLEYIATLRKELVDAETDCFDLLGTYLAEHSSKIVIHKTNLMVSRTGAVALPYPNEAMARIEAVWNNKTYHSGKLFISQPHFNEWCHRRGADSKNFFAQLVQHRVVFHKGRRINLMRGTDKPLPAVRVFEIIMDHERFTDILRQNDIGETQPELRLVGGTAA